LYVFVQPKLLQIITVVDSAV